MLANRLRKKQKQLSKWTRKNNLQAFRLYEKDIPEYPVIVDCYGEYAIVWIYTRTKDETDEEIQAFEEDVIENISQGLALDHEHIVLKKQRRQSGQQSKNYKTNKTIVVEEQGLKYEINLYDYLDVGLFLDHRNTRQMVRELAHGRKVLNLFAYTASFTCNAIEGGAFETDTVDLSNTYNKWAERNFELNDFVVNDQHQILKYDCLEFLKLAQSSRYKYSLIICDPPSFSNSKNRGKTDFSVVDDQVELITRCLSLLSTNGILIFSTNYRNYELNESLYSEKATITNITNQTLPHEFRNRKIHQCWEFIKK